MENKKIRSTFYRDYCRIIHSPSFRRLQGKCQLFPIGESDFFRNRLTHSLEVAQISKGIALSINEQLKDKKIDDKIDIELVEIAGLSHDLGHPPFGHQGEKALDDCMLEDGGFEGNAQTLRILAKLEKKEKRNKSGDYGVKDDADFRYGLNLSYRSLASILKYKNVIPRERIRKLSKKTFKEYFEKTIGDRIKDKDKFKEELKRIYQKLDIKTIFNQLEKHEIINDKGFLHQSFINRIKKITFDEKFEEYKSNIINCLLEWKKDVGLRKGFYESEEKIVKKIRKYVCGDENHEDFKTIECQIMDIADDIAYSTYDIEDALKGNFISILDCLNPKKEVLEHICNKLNDCEDLNRKDYDKWDVIDIFTRIFAEPLNIKELFKQFKEKEIDHIRYPLLFNDSSKKFQINGYERIRLTSSLIAKFIDGVEFKDDRIEASPLLKIQLKERIREEVEVLKHFAYISLISSHLLKIPEYRGYGIVKEIFNALFSKEGHYLLPDDYKEIYNNLTKKSDKKRLICDFIAGMTDRYVLEFYGRLKSENPQSIFKQI